MKIISGGQTGADRAALDAAITLGLPHGGWLPRGRKTEDGPLPARYKLTELNSQRYRDRTEQNIIDSDATLIVSFGTLTGGSALTESLALRHDRPCLIIDLECISREEAIDAVEKWLRKNDITILNIAGPRESGEPRIYDAVYKLLLSIHWSRITGQMTSGDCA
ncbi:MAG: putative molybdenum carrier protein [Desulfobulbaceae bacterium]|nr:putative molybdenum carrier protein [Desulfobulbaceae bacterium]